MLPATLVAIVTFLLDSTNSSPVYNMQPAFITTNIGSTNGRNIRNLPCISRKNNGLKGVCMFAIDCLKSNGTHLGTCIDRFYFGSCCHLNTVHEIENSIETNMILDNRAPPHRMQNRTRISSTPSSLDSSSTSSTTVTINKLGQESTEPSSSTAKQDSTISVITTNNFSSTTSPSSSSRPTSMRPFGQKLPSGDTQSTISTIEVTTVAEKLQTFQIIDGSLLESTTPKLAQSEITRKPTSTRPSTKPPKITTKPRPSVTSAKPGQKPSKPASSTPVKPTTKPTKPSKPFTSRKPTQKPIKPVKVSSTTKRPSATTTSRTSTKRTPSTKPTRKVTKPSANASSAKPPSTTSKRPQVTTEKITRKPPVILTKKPTASTTSSTSFIVTKRPATILEAEITSSSSTPSSIWLSTSSPSTNISVTTSSLILMSTALPSEEPVSKKNITQILENSTINTSANEIIESSENVTKTSTLEPSSSTSIDGTTISSILSGSSSKVPLTTSSPSELSPNISTPTTLASDMNETNVLNTMKPVPLPGLVTWTLEDPKNHTVSSIDNGSVITGNVTEEWVPMTTPDGWVLLPSVTPTTPSSSFTKNETSTTSSLSTFTVPPLVEPISTFIPMMTSAPENTSTPISIEVPMTTISPESMSNATLSSTSFQESTTSSTSVVTSVVTSTSEREKGTTYFPNITEVVGNASTIEGSGGMGTVETSSMETSTEVLNESKPVNMSDFTNVCGRRMWPEARIVGGEKSAFGKWPWQISLRQWRTSTYLHKCGAALLNENWAITAAHCVDNVPPNDLLLRLGEHDLSTETEPFLHEERRVQIVASHPQFDPRTFEYDLALLRFYEPVDFRPNILPVCVPTKDESFVGRTAFVTGWGRLYEDGPLPSVLQEVSVPVINNSVCESMYRSAGYIEHIPHIFICAGWRRGGFDSCEGDSGGPMVIQRDDNRFLLAGVISWGIGCAEQNQPGVYTRISEFRDWINQILQF